MRNFNNFKGKIIIRIFLGRNDQGYVVQIYIRFIFHFPCCRAGKFDLNIYFRFDQYFEMDRFTAYLYGYHYQQIERNDFHSSLLFEVVFFKLLKNMENNV